MRRERVLQPRITVHERGNVGDFARKKSIQEIVLHKKDSICLNGQISCESGLARRHLPAQEDQLRWGAHALVRLVVIQIIAQVITDDIAQTPSSSGFGFSSVQGQAGKNRITSCLPTTSQNLFCTRLANLLFMSGV